MSKTHQLRSNTKTELVDPLTCPDRFLPFPGDYSAVELDAPLYKAVSTSYTRALETAILGTTKLQRPILRFVQPRPTILRTDVHTETALGDVAPKSPYYQGMKCWDLFADEDVVSASMNVVGDEIFLCCGTKVRVWNSTKEQARILLDTQDPENGFTTSVCTSPYGLALGFSNGDVALLDQLTAQTLLRKISPHDATVTCLQSNDWRMVSCSVDGRMLVWDARIPAPISTYKQPNSVAITSASWQPDGRLLAFGSDDGKVTVVDSTTTKIISSRRVAHGAIRALDWNPARPELLAYAGSSIKDKYFRIWNTSSGDVQRLPSDATTGFRWNSSGTEYLVSNQEFGSGAMSGSSLLSLCTYQWSTSKAAIKSLWTLPDPILYMIIDPSRETAVTFMRQEITDDLDVDPEVSFVSWRVFEKAVVPKSLGHDMCIR